MRILLLVGEITMEVLLISMDSGMFLITDTHLLVQDVKDILKK